MRSSGGSSPLTRGAPDTAVDISTDCGLIPAHAGSTGGFLVFPAVPRAHPRSRGEHPAAIAIVTAVCGSSPLTRGAPGLRHAL